jgi:UDP-glucose 4-epimerase
VDAGETWWCSTTSPRVPRRVPPEATLVVGDMGDQALVAGSIEEHGIDAIAHFAAKIVVPESVTDPLAYYLNNTVKSRALIETAVEGRRRELHLLVDGAVYGEPT